IPIVMLTGTEIADESARQKAGAEAFLGKPFSPVELLETIERLAGRLYEGPFRLMTEDRPEEQLLLYARDLRRLLEVERTQRRLMETHTVIGEQMLVDVSLLQGEGIRVIRSHHERWDGRGYPDGLTGEEIPRGGRVFAVADALDAMTSARPYRTPLSWERAVSKLLEESSKQFDPAVIEAFREREPKLRRIYWEL